MSSALKFVGGPKDGQDYKLAPGQPAPLSIMQKDWEGRYKLREGQLVWIPR